MKNQLKGGKNARITLNADDLGVQKVCPKCGGIRVISGNKKSKCMDCHKSFKYTSLQKKEIPIERVKAQIIQNVKDKEAQARINEVIAKASYGI